MVSRGPAGFSTPLLSIQFFIFHQTLSNPHSETNSIFGLLDRAIRSKWRPRFFPLPELLNRLILCPLEGYFQQPCQVWWRRIKRLKSSGSGKKRGLHFDLPVPVAKDLIRKPIDNNFKISLVPNWRFLIYSFHRNLEKIPPGQMAGVRTFSF